MEFVKKNPKSTTKEFPRFLFSEGRSFMNPEYQKLIFHLFPLIEDSRKQMQKFNNNQSKPIFI